MADLAAGRVMLLAKELRRHMGELFDDEAWMIEMGFRPPCVGVLRVVTDAGPLSQREISDRLGFDPSDMVGALDILEKAGLVERQRDPDDRRRHAVSVTPAGRKAADRIDVLLFEAERRALARLDEDERSVLAELVDKALARGAYTEDAAEAAAVS
jgi:DNA-binding MarR family transcriptional regulator